MIRDNGINYRESLSSIELNNIYNNKYRRHIPLVLYKRGGKIPHVFDGRTERRQRMIIREHDTPADNMRTDNIGIPLGYYPEVQPILPESLYEAADNAGITLVPLLGDAIDGLEALNQASKGNYGTAAITAGSLLLPNIIEKPVKKVVKAVAKPVAERIDNLLRRIKGDKYDNLIVKEGDYYTNTSLLDAYNGVNKDIYLSDEDKYMIEQLAQNGVDISKYNMHALEALSKARRESLLSDGRRFVLDHSIDPNLRIMYLFGDNQTKPLGYITYSDDLGEGKYSIGYVENVTLKRRGVIPSKGVSESLYNGAIQDIRSMGGEGIKTGELLASPEATSKVWEHYPNKIQLSEEGIWRRTDPDTLQFIYEGGHPVYLLDEPSYEIPLKSLYFDPNIIDDEGNLSVDWNGDKYHSKGGSMKTWNKLSMRDRYNYIHSNYDILANGGTLDDIKRKFAEGGDVSSDDLMTAKIDVLTPKNFSYPYREKLRDYSFKDRRESDNVLDFRGVGLKSNEKLRELPLYMYYYFPSAKKQVLEALKGNFMPDYDEDVNDIPELWKNDRMKRIDFLNDKYSLRGKARMRYFAEGGPTISDEEYAAIMEKVAENNNPIWNKYREEEGGRPLTVDEEYLRILNDNSYNYRGYYDKYPKSRVNADTHWPDEFKTVYHPTFSDESIYSGVKSQYNPEGLVGGHWDGNTFIPAPWQTNNDYSSGGSIHIKPENRGKFTALKKRTGHSASWFKAHGTPAQKKMATFALNARKWKHGDGGNLFDEGGLKGSSPNEILEKYKGTPHDLNTDKDSFTSGSFSELMNRWNLAEDEEISNWFHSYVNSPGFERIKKNLYKWIHDRHPYLSLLPDWLVYEDLAEELQEKVNKQWKDVKVFPMDMYALLSAYYPRTRNAYVGRLEYRGFNYPFTAGHEFAHGFNAIYPFKYGSQVEVLNMNKNTNLSDDEVSNYHDSLNDEKHGDIWGMKYLLYKEGIYDSRSNKDITPELVLQLREKYPNLRPLLLMDNKKAAWMLNHVAHNNTLQDFREQFANQAAFGGPIVKAANKHLYDEGGNKESKYTPIIYIGGTPQQAREKYWQEYPRMGEVVDSIANVYGIDPVLIKNNLNHEGFVDRRIDENNWLLEEGVDYDKRGLVDDFLSGKDNDEYNTHGFSEYGFDNGVGAPIIHNEVTLPSHITYDISPEDNELGERVMSISGKTPQDNIEITAVMLKRLSDKIKLDYPNLSEYDHNRYVRAFWNRGIANGKRWVKNGAKGYNYKNGGHLFDGESEDTNAFQSIYKAPDDILTPRTFSAPYELLRRRMFNRRESDNVIDLRQKRYDFSELMNELPTIIFPIDDFVPEALKSDRMKYIDYLNNKYALKGKRKIKYGDAFYDFLEKRKARHHYDGESEETQKLNDTKGFYNFDRDKGIIQLPWNTPLRQRMADRREADVIDLRLNRPTFTDWVKELPASFISDFTTNDDYVPEILKTARMKYIDYLNSKYNLLGEKRIRYNDAPDAQRERGRRPWTKEVGFDRKFNIGGNLLGEGGLEQDELSIGNIGFFNHPLLSLKYYGSPLYDLETPFTVAFTDAIIKDKDAFMWNGKMYSTDIDWNKKFEKDANGNIPFQEFANYMYPAVIKILKEKGLPLTNAHNIVRLAGLESLYGTNPVSGKGYNLSGIKWNSKTMGNYNHATNSKDNLEYVDFDNLKDYLEFKIDLLNNRYDAINAENDKDFVDRLHQKSSGINKKGFDYSTNYKGYLNMLLNTRSLDKWLKQLYTPVITRQDNL